METLNGCHDDETTDSSCAIDTHDNQARLWTVSKFCPKEKVEGGRETFEEHHFSHQAETAAVTENWAESNSKAEESAKGRGDIGNKQRQLKKKGQ